MILRGNKMNKNVKKYIKYVKKLMPIQSKDNKEYINLLTEQINEFANEQDKCSYPKIVEEFGEPNEVVGEYIKNLDSTQIMCGLKKNKILKIISTVVIVFCISLWGMEIYRLNKLYYEALSDLHGYYVETIQDEE